MCSYPTYFNCKNSNKNSIVACSISLCGEYLASNSDPVTLKIVSLAAIRYGPLNNNVLNLNDILPSLWENKLSSQIKCLDFGQGNVNQNRLPHRSNKRRITYCDMYNVCILAVGLKSGEIKVYSLVPSKTFDCHQSLIENGGNPKLILHDHYDEITTLSFSFDGSLRLASGSTDGKMCLWDMWDDGNMYQQIKIPNFKPLCCTWGNKCKHVCIVGAMGKGYVYQSEKPCVQIANLNSGHSNDISACRYSSDDSMLITSSFDTSVLIWCAVTFKPLLQIWQTGTKPSKSVMGGQFELNIRDVQISSDCLFLISVSDDKFIRLWNLEDTENPFEKIEIQFEKKQFMNLLRFFPNGRKYLIGTTDGRLIFFDANPGPANLVSLCRKSIRKLLVDKLHLVHSPDLQNQTNCHMDILKNEIPSLLELHFNFPDLRQYSAAQIFDLKSWQNNTTLDVLVEKLPIPRMIKSYILYGLYGSNIVTNSDPRHLGGFFRGRNMSAF